MNEDFDHFVSKADPAELMKFWEEENPTPEEDEDVNAAFDKNLQEALRSFSPEVQEYKVGE